MTLNRLQKLRSHSIAMLLFCCLLPGLPVAPVRAAGAIVSEVDSHLQDNIHYLNARINYSLTGPMLEALHKGVPLSFILTIEISKERDYLWDADVAELEQHYQLEYYALTQQYLVRNINSGSWYKLPALDVALSVLGTIVDLPLIDDGLLEKNAVYTGRLRILLDIEKLPVPLRLLSYMSSEWRLRSEWSSWSLRP